MTRADAMGSVGQRSARLALRIVGLDVWLDSAGQPEKTYGLPYPAPKIRIDLVAANILGRETGCGLHESPKTDRSWVKFRRFRKHTRTRTAPVGYLGSSVDRFCSRNKCS